MAQKKKLQVFVSSTYTDLREERQAAVEAILTAGHIPAGMELFTAGDESQMNVIKRWIDESDVYLLILGGRYGSLEPKSQKSYTQLEYEYAVERGKPIFAAVIEEDYAKERVRNHPLGADVLETEHPQKLKEFRALVLTRMVRFWRDPKDIKLSIMETMAEFSRREDLTGWVPGNEIINAGPLAEEIARIGKENAELREQLARQPSATARYNGITFEEMYTLLANTRVEVEHDDMALAMQKAAKVFGDSEPGLLHLYWILKEGLGRGLWAGSSDLEKALYKLREFGLVRFDASSSDFFLSDTGMQFLLKLRVERGVDGA